jgi:hypothetical protein
MSSSADAEIGPLHAIECFLMRPISPCGFRRSKPGLMQPPIRIPDKCGIAPRSERWYWHGYSTSPDYREFSKRPETSARSNSVGWGHHMIVR